MHTDYIPAMRAAIIAAVAAYLIGSIPFGYVLVRLFKKQDIRTTGSGNIGATNVARTAPILGIATLLLDALKGFLPIWFLEHYILSDDVDVETGVILLSLAALFAVLGHMFPVWLGFRGGKGVATAAGAFLVLCPRAVGFSVLVFLVVLAATRYVSLGSILGTASVPVSVYLLNRSEARDARPLLVSSVLIAILIVLKHHQNIRRIIAGTENRFGRKKVEAATAEK